MKIASPFHTNTPLSPTPSPPNFRITLKLAGFRSFTMTRIHTLSHGAQNPLAASDRATPSTARSASVA